MTTLAEYLKERREHEWRADLRKKLKGKERTDIPRVHMPEQNPNERMKYQNLEVNLGLSEEQALVEASRCMDCANPTCIDGCPVQINIPEFIKNIERKEYGLAAQTLKMTSQLPVV